MTNRLHKWLKFATPDEIRTLARLCETSPAYLSQIANGHRRASAEMAGKIEQATFEIRDETEDAQKRLPKLYRGDLVAACAKCPYFKRGCYGE